MSQQHKFRFRGTCKPCDNPLPHPPHETGGYSTVCFGPLADYCLGVEGAGLAIEVKESLSGCAEFPDAVRGVWSLEVENR